MYGSNHNVPSSVAAGAGSTAAGGGAAVVGYNYGIMALTVFMLLFLGLVIYRLYRRARVHSVNRPN